MAYRFAATLGFAGLLAQSAVALPMAQADVVVTQTITNQPPAATVTAAAQNPAVVMTTVTQAGAVATTITQGAAAPAAATSVAAPAAPAAPSSAAAPAAPSSAAAPAPASSSSSSSSSGSSSAGKPGRGVCVDGNMGSAGSSALQTIVSAVSGKINWYSNWGSTGSDVGGAKFFPMLKSPGMPWSPKGEVALAFNEADLTMSGADACSSFKSEFLGPARSAGMKTATPSFTSTQDPSKGTAWLKTFWDACSDVASEVDFVSPHYYFYAVDAGLTPEDFHEGSSSFQYFTNFITQAHQITGKPVLLTELGLDPTTPNNWSDEQFGQFLATAESWLEKQDFVAGWSAYQVGTGKGNMNGMNGVTQKYVQ